MIKQILNLNGAQQLSKREQESINGGSGRWSSCCGGSLGSPCGPAGQGSCTTLLCNENQPEVGFICAPFRPNNKK